jgi:hypothetical protein
LLIRNLEILCAIGYINVRLNGRHDITGNMVLNGKESYPHSNFRFGK